MESSLVTRGQNSDNGEEKKHLFGVKDGEWVAELFHG